MFNQRQRKSYLLQQLKEGSLYTLSFFILINDILSLLTSLSCKERVNSVSSCISLLVYLLPILVDTR